MIYRDDEEALRARRRDLLVARQAELRAAPPGVWELAPRRLGRIAAGVTGIAGAVLMTFCTAARASGATLVLMATWPAMLLVGLFVRSAARARGHLAVLREYAPGEDVAADIERLEVPLARLLAERSGPLERAATALPLIAGSLLLPLSIHLLVYAGISGVGAGEVDVEAFDKWIALSLAIVGHCHLVLAFLGWRFARSATQKGGVGVDDQGWLAWWIVIVASVVSGLLLVFFLPYAALALVFVVPGLVTTTGLLFIPALFSRAARRIRHERALLG
jgi:hypothetical protein